MASPHKPLSDFLPQRPWPTFQLGSHVQAASVQADRLGRRQGRIAEVTLGRWQLWRPIGW